MKNISKFTTHIIYGLTMIVILWGCANRNELGRRRPIYIGKKQSEFAPTVFTLIDTTCLYERVDKFTDHNPEPTGKYLKEYLKFYPGGRVGVFYLNNADEITTNTALLNPKRANVGYYRFSEKGFEIITHFEHVQGGGFIKELLTKSGSDSLVFSYQQKINTVYHKKVIPAKALIYSPDWK